MLFFRFLIYFCFLFFLLETNNIFNNKKEIPFFFQILNFFEVRTKFSNQKAFLLLLSVFLFCFVNVFTNFVYALNQIDDHRSSKITVSCGQSFRICNVSVFSSAVNCKKKTQKSSSLKLNQIIVYESKK